MTQEKYLAALSELFDNALVLTKAKSTDYSGPNDAFANFQLVETLTQGKITAEMGIVVRMSDKIQRISNLLLAGKAEVKDERVSDTCKDLMIYAAILHIMTQRFEAPEYAVVMSEEANQAMKKKPLDTTQCTCLPKSASLEEYCQAFEKVTGYSCTRPAGHEGRHISCNSFTNQHNLASWPQTVDPIHFPLK